jgi:SynChlorMet cassette radical SAM/SPASM protein ScmF
MDQDKACRIVSGERESGAKEQAAPTLETIYFYLTEGCNLRCRHCWMGPKYEAGEPRRRCLDVELFRAIVSQAIPLGLAAVKLTGGEPLLHPGIEKILDIARQENLHLTMETNGVLCTPALAERIASCGQPFVSVSLDGADAATHEWVRGVEGCFEAALQGIRNLVAAGIRPQVIMTLMRRNAGQIEDLLNLAKSLGASSVKLNIVQPTSRGVEMHRAGETHSIAELIRIGEWIEHDLSHRAPLPLRDSRPAAFRPLGRIFGQDSTGCGTCGILHILGVLADGSYALCGIGEHVPELLFGHAARDPLGDVWRDSPVLGEIREGMPRRLEGVCGKCILRTKCMGACIAQNYYTHKNLWSAFWYCEEAHRLGLFPETRRRGENPLRRAETDLSRTTMSG